MHFRHGPHIAFSSRSFLGVGRAESRWSGYAPFVDALVTEVRRANPEAKFIAGMPMRLWLLWLLIVVGATVLALVALIFVVSLAIIRSTDIDDWPTRLPDPLRQPAGPLTFYSVLAQRLAAGIRPAQGRGETVGQGSSTAHGPHDVRPEHPLEDRIDVLQVIKIIEHRVDVAWLQLG